jgi:peroxiredoxin
VKLSARARDWVVTGGFLVVVGALVAVGWFNRATEARPGEPAPALGLRGLEGSRATLADYRGQVVLLNVWATWCAPCRLEMPAMQAVYERYRDRGLEIVAVSVDQTAGPRFGSVEELVRAFVDDLGLTFPVFLDPSGETERTLAVAALPTTLLIDRSGRIRAREVGGRYWDREPHVDVIESLLEE